MKTPASLFAVIVILTSGFSYIAGQADLFADRKKVQGISPNDLQVELLLIQQYALTGMSSLEDVNNESPAGASDIKWVGGAVKALPGLSQEALRFNSNTTMGNLLTFYEEAYSLATERLRVNSMKMINDRSVSNNNF
jgi:hypothetical protein